MTKSATEANPSAANAALLRGKRKPVSPVIHPTLLEAVEGDGLHKVRCEIIDEGRGNSRENNFYGIESLTDLAALLEGGRAFANHQTAEEEEERSEGDILLECGFWRDVVLGDDPEKPGKKRVTGTLCMDDSTVGRDVYAKCKAAMAHEAQFGGGHPEPYVGISINADGIIDPRVIREGEQDVEVNYVTRVMRLRSADVVTRPARGGRIVALLESVREMSTKEADHMRKRLEEAVKKIVEAFKGTKTDEDAPKAAESMVAALEQFTEATTVKHIKHEERHTTRDDAPDEKEPVADDEEKPGAVAEDEAEAECEACGAKKSNWRQSSEKSAASAPRKGAALREARLTAKVDLLECKDRLREAKVDPKYLSAEELVKINPSLRDREIRNAKAMQAHGFISEAGETERTDGSVALHEAEALAAKASMPTWGDLDEKEA